MRSSFSSFLKCTNQASAFGFHPPRDVDKLIAHLGMDGRHLPQPFRYGDVLNVFVIRFDAFQRVAGPISKIHPRSSLHLAGIPAGQIMVHDVGFLGCCRDRGPLHVSIAPDFGLHESILPFSQTARPCDGEASSVPAS